MIRHRLAISLIFLVCGYIYTNWSTRLPHIQAQFDLSNSTLGLVLLCVAIGSLTSMPLTGWLVAQRGSKFSTTLSALLFCGTLFLFPLAHNTWQLSIFFYVVGFFTGALDVAMNAQAVALEQRAAQPMMSSFHAIFSIGMMLGALTSSFFVQYDIYSHFFIVSGACLVLTIACIPYLVKDATEPTDEGFKLVWPGKALLLMGIIAFCAMLGEGAMADWSTNYLKNVINTTDALAPLGLSSFSAAMTLGRFGGDKVRSWLGDRKLIFFNSLLATLGLIVALSFSSVWGVIVGLFAVGLGLSTIIPVVYSQAGHHPSLPNGVGLAMVTTLGYFGFLFGPPVIGFLADWQGLRFALFFVVGLFSVMLLLSRKIT